MLSDNFSEKRAKEKATPAGSRGMPFLAILIAGKSLRAISLFTASTYLLETSIPIGLFALIVLVLSALGLLLIQRPWISSHSLTARQWVGIFVNSLLFLSSFVLWSKGLKHCGAMRTALFDYLELCFVFVLEIARGKSGATTTVKSRALFFMIAAFILLLWHGSSPADLNPQNAGILTAAEAAKEAAAAGVPQDELNRFEADPASNNNNLADGNLNNNLDPNNNNNNNNNIINSDSINNNVLPPPTEEDLLLGFVLLAVAVLLSILRKGYARRISHDIGGSKRLHAISLSIAAVLAIPLALFQEIFVPSNHIAFFTWSRFFMLACIAAFMCLVPFYTDSIAASRLSVSTVTRVGAVSSVVLALLMQQYYDSAQLNFASFGAAACLIFAIQSISSNEQSGSDLPMYGGAGGAMMSSMVKTSPSLLRTYVRHIFESPNSRRIFSFLCINFAFMFVELIYGLWTNSLGLIADAGHMLFDCGALAIGLYGSFMATWKPTSSYSYGYGRYEVLCGFVNGILLVFISFLVFSEAIERIFGETPHVHTERLLAVSVMGFLVNMVGLFAFHDHGHGGHSHASGGCSGNTNMKGVFLHVLADTLGSVGVIISSLAIEYKGWMIADPICSLILSAMIFGSVIPLIQSTASILLQRTPSEMEGSISRGLNRLLTIDGVKGYRSPHFWQHTDAIVVGTVRVVVTHAGIEQTVLARASKILHELGVSHLAVQVEVSDGGSAQGDGLISHELQVEDSDSDHSHSHSHSHSHAESGGGGGHGHSHNGTPCHGHSHSAGGGGDAENGYSQVI